LLGTQDSFLAAVLLAVALKRGKREDNEVSKPILDYYKTSNKH